MLKFYETLLKACDSVIIDQLEKCIIEVVEDKSMVNGPLHYIPHHSVVTPGKTTKVRIVYDASAKQACDSKLLNDCLDCGPILVPDIAGILMRFRLNKIGMISDIAKVFLQIALHQDQRDCTRFSG